MSSETYVIKVPYLGVMPDGGIEVLLLVGVVPELLLGEGLLLVAHLYLNSTTSFLYLITLELFNICIW